MKEDFCKMKQDIHDLKNDLKSAEQPLMVRTCKSGTKKYRLMQKISTFAKDTKVFLLCNSKITNDFSFFFNKHLYRQLFPILSYCCLSYFKCPVER